MRHFHHESSALCLVQDAAPSWMVGEDLQECVLAAGKTVATLWDAHRRCVDVRLMPQLCTRPAPATLRNPKLHCFAELILCDSLCGDYTLLSMWQTCTVVWVMRHFVFLWDCRNSGKSPHYDHQSAVEVTAALRNTHSMLTPNSPVQATLFVHAVCRCRQPLHVQRSGASTSAPVG